MLPGCADSAGCSAGCSSIGSLSCTVQGLCGLGSWRSPNWRSRPRLRTVVASPAPARRISKTFAQSAVVPPAALPRDAMGVQKWMSPSEGLWSWLSLGCRIDPVGVMNSSTALSLSLPRHRSRITPSTELKQGQVTSQKPPTRGRHFSMRGDPDPTCTEHRCSMAMAMSTIPSASAGSNKWKGSRKALTHRCGAQQARTARRSAVNAAVSGRCPLP
mmetsp:Transcript_115801/g.258848  ORF Transcript_115801/g.258848 Transcript_115801/m.258848 type:complete len:216 (-) Transcript_115801:514-1161(-)